MFWATESVASNPVPVVCTSPQAANLRAQVFSLKGESDVAAYLPVLGGIPASVFAPRDGIKIAADEKEAAKEKAAALAAGPVDELDELIKELPARESLAGTATSTSFWTSSRAALSSMRPHTRRGMLDLVPMFMDAG